MVQQRFAVAVRARGWRAWLLALAVGCGATFVMAPAARAETQLTAIDAGSMRSSAKRPSIFVVSVSIFSSSPAM